MEKEWPEPESNRRHKDFQSSALPTELPSHRLEAIYGRVLRNLAQGVFAVYADHVFDNFNRFIHLKI